MFSRIAALLPLAALVAVVAAGDSSSCSSGNTYCCDQDFTGKTGFMQQKDGTLVEAVLDAILEGGISCTPISVIAIAGQQCNTQTACCNGEKNDGLVNMSCSPINVNA